MRTRKNVPVAAGILALTLVLPADPLLVAYGRIAIMGDVESKRLGRAWKLVANGRLESKLLQHGTDAFSCECKDFQVRSARDGWPG